MNEERENTTVTCPVCETEFMTATDSLDSQCPKCEFKFELAKGE